MTIRSIDKQRTPLIRALVIGVGAVALLAACSGDGSRLDDVDLGGGVEAPVDGGSSGDEVQAEEPAPEPEAPASEAPAPEAPPVQLPDLQAPVDDDGLTTEEWVVLIIMGVAAFALIMVVVALATNHSDKKKAVQSSQNRRVGELVGLGHWILDQGSVEVLRATEAQQLQTAWLTMRARSIDLETRSASLARTTDDRDVSEMVLRLAAEVAGLRGSLETNVSLRLDPNAAANTTLIDDTTRSVYQRRQDVQMDLSRLAAVRA